MHPCEQHKVSSSASVHMLARQYQRSAKDADALEQQDVGRDESIRLMRLTPMALHKIMFTFPNLRNGKAVRKKSSETSLLTERASCKCDCSDSAWSAGELGSLCFAFVVCSDETEEIL